MKFLKKYIKESMKKKEVKNGRKMAEKIVKPFGKGCSEFRRFNSFSYIINDKAKNRK